MIFFQFVIKVQTSQKDLCHRFIYESIRGVIPEGFQIDHINNCKTDNGIKNLQLLTPQENHN